MHLETIKKLCCPFDKSDLTLKIITIDHQDNVLEGLLLSTTSDRVYPIVSGIPIMSPDEYRDFKMEQPILERWIKYLDGNNADNYLIGEGRLKMVDGEGKQDFVQIKQH